MSAHELYLIRHGVAEERGDAWPDDSRRPLTDDGISRLKKSARGIIRLGVEFDVILTSALVRARQTAEVFAAAFNTRPPIVVIESLAPDGSPQSVINDLEKHSRRARIALVGHEPGIGELAARLVGSRRPIEFRRAPSAASISNRFPPPGRAPCDGF
jgi:phosphohistidine phosphatase